MSLIAIDLGNCNIVGAVPRGKGVDVVVSDSSSKVIPSVVSYTQDRRYFADEASAQRISNRLQCFTHLPLIIGEASGSAAVQRARFAGAEFDISDFNSRAVSRISFGGEDLCVEFDQVAAALLGQMKKYAESMDKVMPEDFVIALPSEWALEKKMKLMAAARATGLNCLGVVSEHAAVAANYYMRRVAEFEKLPDSNEGVKIGFIAVGEIESWASVVQMNKQGVTVLGFASDAQLGSIDFDKILAELILEKALQKCREITRDELMSKKSQIKIMRAANECKKVLSLNSNAPATLECVGDSQIDIQVLISLAEFVERSESFHLIERAEALVSKALEQAQTTDLEAFESIGGASRVKPIEEMLAARFGERISRRLNADEAVAVGACWIGAMRSSKHHIPFDIKIVDEITNLKEKLIFEVFNEDGTEVFEQPFDMFKNSEIFPKSKKITLRFAPGVYTARLFDGATLIEETKFTVASKNFVEFDAHKEFAAANGVKFEDETVELKVKIVADENGFFKLAELQRNDEDLVFDDVKKKVLNENYESENAAFEAEKAKIEEEFAAKMKSFDELTAIYEQKMKEYEAVKNESSADSAVLSSEVQKSAKPDMEKPIKPIKEEYPTVPSKEKEITEKIPRVANYSRDITAETVYTIYNENDNIKRLMEFEEKCKEIDRAALRYDAAINELDSLIYETREAFDYGNLHDYVTDAEKLEIHEWLEEAGIYRNEIEGRHETEEIEQKSSALEVKLQPFYTRKASHEQADERIYMLKSDVSGIEARYELPECVEGVMGVEAAYEALSERFSQLDKKALVPDDFFKEFTEQLAQAEQQLRARVKESESAKKAAEEAAKAAVKPAEEQKTPEEEKEQKKQE